MIDLSAAREERAAKREVRGGNVEVRIDTGDPIRLPVELPLDTLAPLKALHLDENFGALFQQRTMERAEQVVRDLLTLRPTLLTDLVDAGTGCLERLFCSCDPHPWDAPVGDDGTDPAHLDGCQWRRFLAFRPSPQDLWALVRELWDEYGADLGEALAPAASAGNGGATSNPTSDSTPAPTPATSGDGATTPA